MNFGQIYAFILAVSLYYSIGFATMIAYVARYVATHQPIHPVKALWVWIAWPVVWSYDALHVVMSWLIDNLRPLIDWYIKWSVRRAVRKQARRDTPGVFVDFIDRIGRSKK